MKLQNLQQRHLFNQHLGDGIAQLFIIMDKSFHLRNARKIQKPLIKS